MSENLQKLIGVAVMAALVVVGVAVSSGDDTDYTRNVSFRDNPERLEGGDRLEDPDCCDQNAYEILKLQNELKSLETEVELNKTEAKKTSRYLQGIIAELKEESCSLKVLRVKQQGSGHMCAYLEHANLRTVVDGVGVAWLHKDEGSLACQLLEFGMDYAGSVIEDEFLGGLNAFPDQNFCSEESLEQPASTGDWQYLKLFTDKYVDFTLECPTFVSLIPPSSGKYFPWTRPGLSVRHYASSPHLIEVAPTDSWGQSGGMPMTFDYGEQYDSPKVLSPGYGAKFVQWDKSTSNWWDHYETGSITLRITDVVTDEVHYLTVTGTVNYVMHAETANALKEGTAKARCEGDLTIWRTYDEGA